MPALSDPPVESESPDYLAGALLRSLSRHLGSKAAWGFVKTLVWSTLTLGVGPLFSWPGGLAHFIRLERQQFLHLSEWMRLRSGHPQAGELVLAAGRIGPSLPLARLPGLIGFGVAAAFVYHVGYAGLDFSLLLDSTYNMGRHWPGDPATANRLFTLWVGGLTLAYALHGLQLLRHLRNVRGVVDVFNRLVASEGLPPVPGPRGAGFGPIWIIAALLMCSASAIWAIPMMLAGGMQRRYIDAAGPAMRAAVAERLRDLLLLRRPAMRLPMPVTMPRRCPNKACRSAMPRIATFCPRCGVHVGPSVDELA